MRTVHSDGYILALDANSANYEKLRADWAKHRIGLQFAISMEQALDLLHHRDYLLIVINAENLEYLPWLADLVAVTPVPVLVLAKEYNHTAKLAATKAGVTAYLGDMTFEAAITCAWFLICQLHQPRTKPVEPLHISTHRNILLCEQCHVVFVDGQQIELPPREFTVLEYLMSNAGRVKSHELIYEYAWGNMDTGQARKVVSNLISKLRQNLNAVINADDLIIVVRETGYKIDTH